jgi:hypothetical protein
MSGSQDAEHPSRSPRRVSFEGANSSTEKRPDVASSPQPLAHNALPYSMPNPDRIRYSNKESAKVNAGLGYGAWHNEQKEDSAADLLHTNKPAVDIDFSQLIAPILLPEHRPTSEVLARRLLYPPPYAFVHGTLSIQWVIGVVGRKHIQFRKNDERYVLAKSSDLRKRGAALGLPALYMEWLCGDDSEISAAEQNVALTPSFFDNLKLE